LLAWTVLDSGIPDSSGFSQHQSREASLEVVAEVRRAQEVKLGPEAVLPVGQITRCRKIDRPSAIAA
jgi:hypothetical protein